MFRISIVVTIALVFSGFNKFFINFIHFTIAKRLYYLNCDDNNKDDIQYIMDAHLSNQSFMYLLTTQDTFLSNKANTA